MRDSMEGGMADEDVTPDDEYDPDEDLTEAELNDLYESGSPVIAFFSSGGDQLPWGCVVTASTNVSGGSQVIALLPFAQPFAGPVMAGSSVPPEAAQVG
jgi:hypothetical protein